VAARGAADAVRQALGAAVVHRQIGLADAVAGRTLGAGMSP
jgi:hypothetical protein